MERQNNTWKSWAFPSVISIIGMFAGMMLNDIKSDLAEVKADIKVLMAQSNIDKTRIENLERAVFKASSSIPPVQPENISLSNSYAILPDNKIKTKKI